MAAAKEVHDAFAGDRLGHELRCPSDVLRLFLPNAAEQILSAA
jgi:hypothetical protein